MPRFGESNISRFSVNGSDPHIAISFRGTVPDPVQQQPVVFRTALKHPATLVFHLFGGLEEQQTLHRLTEINPPPGIFAGDLLVILSRIITKQAKPQATLPCRRTVAFAGIATGLGKDRKDVRRKTEWLGTRGRSANAQSNCQ